MPDGLLPRGEGREKRDALEENVKPEVTTAASGTWRTLIKYSWTPQVVKGGGGLGAGGGGVGRRDWCIIEISRHAFF